MLVVAFWLLLAAALGGSIIAALDLGAAPVRLAHGLLAGVGLLILLIAALGQGSGPIWTAFGLLLLGFAAGVTFFGVIWRDSAPPRAVIIGHGIVNALGVILLGLGIIA